MSVNNNNPLVSVIIPIYNAEIYLEEALCSAINQSYKNLEIICVNDGSSDNSLSIIQRYALKDSRIKNISQRNQGAGVARNRGIDEAQGQYILFFDADDFLNKNMISTLVDAACNNDSEIIIFGYYKFSERKRIFTDFSAKTLKIPFNKILSPTDIANRLFQGDHGMPWNKFYKTDFVKKSGVRFQNLKNTNDEYFSRLTTVKAHRILFLDKCLIGYRVRNNNSLQGNAKDNILDCTKALIAIHDELKNIGYYDMYYETYQKLSGYIIILKLLAVLGSEAFDILANEVSNNTIEQCEIEELYLEEGHRGAFTALKGNDVLKVREELEVIKNNQGKYSVKQRLKRLLI